MVTVDATSCVAQVGVTAGAIWAVLDEKGPLSITKLVEAVNEPRAAVMLGLGWLAREGKICIEENGRSRVVSLS